MQPIQNAVIETKQNKIFSFFILLLFLSCKKNDNENFKNYEVILSNNDFEINLKTGKIESNYFKISESIIFSKNEELQFSKLFFENNLKKLNGDIEIHNDDRIIIQPDIGTSIWIKYYGKEKSTLSISEFADSLKVKKSNIPYLRFESKVYKILENNKEFQKIKKQIDSKDDDRIYL